MHNKMTRYVGKFSL